MDHFVDKVRVFLSLLLECFEVLIDKVIDHCFSLVLGELLRILDLPVVDGLLSFLGGDLQNWDLSELSADGILTGLFFLAAGAAAAIAWAFELDSVEGGEKRGSGEENFGEHFEDCF